VARAHILEVDREPVVERISADLEPGVQRRVILLELHRLVLRHGLAVLQVEGGANGFGKLFPDIATDQLSGVAIQQQFRPRVQVSETPIPIEREEGVGNAAQDAGQALGGVPQCELGLQLVADILERAMDPPDASVRGALWLANRTRPKPPPLRRHDLQPQVERRAVAYASFQRRTDLVPPLGGVEIECVVQARRLPDRPIEQRVDLLGP
jgi:hypothetical protein